MSEESPVDETLKIVLLGDSGKISLTKVWGRLLY